MRTRIRLTFCTAPFEGQSVVIDASGTTIGRADDCGIQVPDGSLSRRHAMFHCHDGTTWQIEDLGSANGTFLDHAEDQLLPHTETRLRKGATLHLGHLETRVDIEPNDGTAFSTPSTQPEGEPLVESLFGHHKRLEERPGGLESEQSRDPYTATKLDPDGRARPGDSTLRPPSVRTATGAYDLTPRPQPSPFSLPGGAPFGSLADEAGGLPFHSFSDQSQEALGEVQPHWNQGESMAVPPPDRPGPHKHASYPGITVPEVRLPDAASDHPPVARPVPTVARPPSGTVNLSHLIESSALFTGPEPSRHEPSRPEPSRPEPTRPEPGTRSGFSSQSPGRASSGLPAGQQSMQHPELGALQDRLKLARELLSAFGESLTTLNDALKAAERAQPQNEEIKTARRASLQSVVRLGELRSLLES